MNYVRGGRHCFLLSSLNLMISASVFTGQSSNPLRKRGMQMFLNSQTRGKKTSVRFICTAGTVGRALTGNRHNSFFTVDCQLGHVGEADGILDSLAQQLDFGDGFPVFVLLWQKVSGNIHQL